MSNYINKEIIQNSIINKMPIFIPDYETDLNKLANWADVARQFRINLEKPDSGENNKFHSTKGHAHFMDKNNFYLDHIHLIETKIRHLAKKIQEVHPKKRITTATTIATLDDVIIDKDYSDIQKIMYDNYISINKFSLKAHHEPSLHNDETDNLYLQCYGEVEWVVHNKKYLIKPGQAIFVPAFTDHIVHFKKVPRMAIIMNFLSDTVDKPSLPQFDETTGKTYYEYNKNI